MNKPLLMEVSVKLLIKNKKNEIILLKRRDSKKWVFPGGRIEEGQTVFETGKREALEELNVKIKNQKIIGFSIAKRTDGKSHVVIFQTAEISSGTAENKDTNEHSELEWFNELKPPKDISPITATYFDSKYWPKFEGF